MDAKVIASATNKKLRSLLNKVSSIQSGFIPGRRFLDHIVKADTYSRTCGLQQDAESNRPCIVRMGIAAAFPSLLHTWLWDEIRRWGVHGRLFNLVYFMLCLLYTSDAADDTPCVDL
eukprot:5361105-Pyramimonas_sp.AAC.1